MKTLLQMEMYYVREYTPTRRLLRVSLIIFKNLQVDRILHYLSITSLCFFFKFLPLYLCNNTPNKAIVNAASNITYKPLMEADDTIR